MVEHFLAQGGFGKRHGGKPCYWERGLVSIKRDMAPSPERLANWLREALGELVHAEGVDHLAPWSVLRCRLKPGPHLGSDTPRSVIVKWLREDPRGVRSDPRQVATEQAALEFLAQIEFACAPRLIAAERNAGMLMLEDLAPRIPLAHLIRRQGAAASTTERHAFARAMGALNAATVGKLAAYDAIRSRCGPVGPSMDGRCLGPDWAVTRQRLEALGLGLSSDVERELARVIEIHLHPGPFLALSNGDPEENNFLVDRRDGRLIDFEFAAYRLALTCARWIHVPGPAWITVLDSASAELEHTYRVALSQGIPEAEDDRLFGLGMAAVCLAFACDRLCRFVALDQRRPGDASRLQMVATLESAARAARRHRSLLQLAGWAERASHWLRRRWPDTDVDFARYPAYASR